MSCDSPLRHCSMVIVRSVRHRRPPNSTKVSSRSRITLPSASKMQPTKLVMVISQASREIVGINFPNFLICMDLDGGLSFSEKFSPIRLVQTSRRNTDEILVDRYLFVLSRLVTNLTTRGARFVLLRVGRFTLAPSVGLFVQNSILWNSLTIWSWWELGDGFWKKKFKYYVCLSVTLAFCATDLLAIDKQK